MTATALLGLLEERRSRLRVGGATR
jgi:hypothetical protein